MIITLNSYLARLKDEERFKPKEERRKVPTISDLAEVAKVSRVQMQRIVGGDVQSLKLVQGSRIIRFMRKAGFSMDVSDLLEYRD